VLWELPVLYLLEPVAEVLRVLDLVILGIVRGMFDYHFCFPSSRMDL
jgi:hypothetical protein